MSRIYEKMPETTEVIVAQVTPTRKGIYPLIIPSNTLVNDILAEYNARIPEVVDKFRADGKHVSYVDMWGVFQSDSEFDEVGLHPNPTAAENCIYQSTN